MRKISALLSGEEALASEKIQREYSIARKAVAALYGSQVCIRYKQQGVAHVSFFPPPSPSRKKRKVLCNAADRCSFCNERVSDTVKWDFEIEEWCADADGISYVKGLPVHSACIT
jgi:hypothetical protein